MSVDKQAYLGDSVYATLDGYDVVLTTNNGYRDDPRNRIVLEPEVLDAFMVWVARVKKEMAEEAREMSEPTCNDCCFYRELFEGKGQCESSDRKGYLVCRTSPACRWFVRPAPFPPPQSPTGKVCPACGKAVTSDGKRSTCGCEA